MPRSCRMSSAAGVVGPLAPSTTTRARVARTLDGELAFERGGHEELALEAPEPLGCIGAAPAKPFRPPFAAVCASAAGMSMPASFTRMAVWSAIAITRAPASWNMRAPMPPTLPKPCTTTRAPSIGRRRWRAASRAAMKTPRPVDFLAAQAAAERDQLAGDDAGGGAAVHREGVHHDRHRHRVGADVGAGMSLSGPMMMPISEV